MQNPKKKIVTTQLVGLSKGQLIEQGVFVKMHFLKTWVNEFDAVVDGRKRFELRKNDRGFKVGDILILAKYDRDAKKILPGFVCAPITYILESFPGIKTGYCVLGFQNSIDADERMKNYYTLMLTKQLNEDGIITGT
ncbi:DUF3850 domain-containing protein [Spirosoma lituiforme]